MDTFKQFFFDQQTRELYRAKARLVWRDVQQTPGAAWARYLINDCGYMTNAETKDKDCHIVDYIVNIFYKYLVEHEENLETDPYYRKFRQSIGTEQTEDFRKLINGQFNRFKHYCTEQWRKKDGTFAKSYRRIQQVLSDNIKDDWSMYCNGQFYGPTGIDEPCALLLSGDSYKNFWQGLTLPSESPEETDLFVFKALGPLSKYFYERLCWFVYGAESGGRTEKKNNDIVAVRFFVCWLCYAYNLLDPQLEALPDDTVAGKAAPLPPPPQHILDKFAMVAADLAVKMSADDRLLFRQLLEGVTLETIAPRLGLRGSSNIFARKNKLATWLQSEMHKYPELCASDEEAFLEAPYDYDMLREHFRRNLRDCCMPCEKGGSA